MCMHPRCGGEPLEFRVEIMFPVVKGAEKKAHSVTRSGKQEGVKCTKAALLPVLQRRSMETAIFRSIKSTRVSIRWS